MPSFVQHSTRFHQTARQIEKSIFAALTIGSHPDHIGAEFGVPDLAWRIRRLQLAHFYGWSLSDIDSLTLTDLADALAYRAAYLNARAVAALPTPSIQRQG